MMKESVLFTVNPWQSKMILCISPRDEINVFKDPEYVLVSGPKELEFWSEQVKVVGAPIISR